MRNKRGPRILPWGTRFFFYKHKVHKHTQPQIREILSTLLSTPPASDFEIDIKISGKLQFFPKISEKNSIFPPNLQNYDLNTELKNALQCFPSSHIHCLILL